MSWTHVKIHAEYDDPKGPEGVHAFGASANLQHKSPVAVDEVAREFLRQALITAAGRRIKKIHLDVEEKTILTSGNQG